MRGAAVWPVLLVLAGCAGGTSPPLSVTDRATAAACRQQANATYNIRNRDQIYSIRDPFTPQSSTGLTDLPTRDLSDRYTQERQIRDCIRNTGTETDRSGQAPMVGTGLPNAPGAAGRPSGAPPPAGSPPPGGSPPPRGSLSR